MSNFIPTIWSKKIQDSLKDKEVLVANCTKEYEGEIKYGNTINILATTKVTVGDYTGADITVGEVDDKVTKLVIDKRKYFAFHVDDVDKVQALPGYIDKYTSEAIDNLAYAREKYIGEIIKTGTNVTTVTGKTVEALKTGIDSAIVAMRERNFFGKANIELDPKAYNDFKGSIIITKTDNVELISKGVIGMYDGNDVVMSNALAKDGTHRYLAIRNQKAIAFAGQLKQVESIREPKTFKTLIRGLDVYGAKLIDNDKLQVIKVPV